MHGSWLRHSSKRGSQKAKQAKQGNTAVKPVPRDKNWVKRHEAFVAMAKRGGIGLADALTQSLLRTQEAR